MFAPLDFDVLSDTGYLLDLSMYPMNMFDAYFYFSVNNFITYTFVVYQGILENPIKSSLLFFSVLKEKSQC